MSLHEPLVASPRPPSAAAQASSDPRLQNAYRFQQGGWTYVHLEGSPEHIGFQHGYLLAREIADAFEAVKLEDTHTTKRDWDFFRKAAHEMLWPKIDLEYQQELTGIVEGLKAQGVAMDVDDLVALNAFEELPGYYVPWYDQQQHVAGAPRLSSPGNCSAFIATGSYTRDHQIVIAHNNWTSYLVGSRWVIVFDIVPEHGNRILMDGFPGVITSDDDFGVNSAGIMVAETTIAQFVGWDPQGKPEFVRSRKALQYANSIDDYARIIRDGNNGGYANDWLIGDRKTGEIGYLELGLKHTPMWRTKDGYFVSSNFARDPGVIKDETSGFDPKNASTSPNARHIRWEQLIKQSKGQIDVGMAEELYGRPCGQLRKEGASGRAQLVRPRGCFAEGRETLGLGNLLSRRRGPRESDRQRHGSAHEFSGAGRASLWPGFHCQGFLNRASRLLLGSALAS